MGIMVIIGHWILGSCQIWRGHERSW